MLDWEWYDDTNCVRVFLHLLLKANWTDSEYKGHHVPRGSVVVGRKALSAELGISERCLRTTSKRLTECHAIDIKTTNKFSIISVCNFDTYNPSEMPNDQQTTSKRPAKCQANDDRTTTSKEDKKIISEEVKNLFERAWSDYGKKGSKKTALTYWKKLNDQQRSEIIEKIPRYVADQEHPQFQKDFQGWINPANELWKNKLKSDFTKHPTLKLTQKTEW